MMNNNRWHLYSTLKGDYDYNISDFETMDPKELKEGLIEYLLTKSHSVGKNKNGETIYIKDIL